MTGNDKGDTADDDAGVVEGWRAMGIMDSGEWAGAGWCEMLVVRKNEFPFLMEATPLSMKFFLQQNL